MTVVYERNSIRLHHGDCLSVMSNLGVRVDSVITDPPYGLGFMGKKWDTPGSMFERKADTKNRFDHVGGNHNPCNSKDRQRTQLSEGRKFHHWCTNWAEACLQVTKPGGMLMAFGGTRTFHRLACAIEDAGWEIRDTIMWVYGSGFPKSLDIHKATGDDKWQGYGTAIKPAWEPIIVAMKPLDGTFAENAQRHGVAGLAIDACRIPLNGDYKCGANGRPSQTGLGDNYRSDMANIHSPIGRFPANLIHDGSDEVLAGFPEQSGGGTPSRRFSDKTRNVLGEFKGHDCPPGIGATAVNASRFFYCAKASRSERGKTNSHPTVKPLSLMRYLCRLTKTPTGGIVLDPFSGSGSTLIAASLEGREAIGIEQDEGHCGIAIDRFREQFRERQKVLVPA